MNATKLLTHLGIAAALLGSVVFAEDRLKGTLASDGKQAVAFALHGKTSCVLMDDKVFCAPAIAPKRTLAAAPAAN